LNVGSGTVGFLTRILIGINVLVYAAELATGSGIDANTGWIFQKCALVSSNVEFANTLAPLIYPGPVVGVAHGDWWRLITAAFLHGGPLHLAMNMYVLWWVGGPLEAALGRARFIGLYLAAGLAGSAGALVLSPDRPTVGASGAIFGLLGAAFVLERSGRFVLGGQAFGIIVLNIVITFVFAGQISVGGHLGGLAGGILIMLALTEFRRSRALTAASIVAVAVASVVVAYWKVRGYA
jgi:membrane associated rhomboid family serine protease